MQDTMVVEVEAAAKIREPEEDVLAQTWLHKVMLVLHKPANWPHWTMGLVFLLLWTTTAVTWWLGTKDSQSVQTVALFQALFMAIDIAILYSLPKRGLSYGPWQSQFILLAVPRFIATAVASLICIIWTLQLGAGFFLIVQLIGTIALIWGAEIEPFRLRLTEFIMFTPRLTAGCKPIRVLHITDLHIERLTAREEQLLTLVQKAKPDLIVITGDYVNLSYNRDPQTHQQVQQLLRQLKAPGGVFATLGSPTVDLRDQIPPLFDGLPVTLLRHGLQEVDLGHGRRLLLLGLDCTHHLPTDRARLAHLVAAAPNDQPQLLLYHSPELMPEATDHGIDLYLCGHTHGGQVRLPFIGPIFTSSQLGREFVMGLYRHGRTHLYVSRGIGLEGLSAPRVRFLCPPEVTLVTIRPAN